MSTAERLQAASQSSLSILEDIHRAQSVLAAFDQTCLSEDGILRQADQCSDALTAAIRQLLGAQKRLVETRWPDPDETIRADAAE